MRHRFIVTPALVVMLSAAVLWGQTRAIHWRGAGSTPCVGSDGGVMRCPPQPGLIAIEAGRLFDSNTVKMLTNQLIIIAGERITAVGPQAQIKIPANAQVICLSRATVLPGPIDAHMHIFDNHHQNGTTENSILIAVQNTQADLRAGQ